MSDYGVRAYEWCPGNGTRYDILFGQVTPNWYLICWMRLGGSGGVAFRFEHGSHVHFSYIMEKMKINAADADGILCFLETQEACTVGHSPDFIRWGRTGELAVGT